MTNLSHEQQLRRAEKNKRRKERHDPNRDQRDPRLIDLENRVRALKEDINLETVYDIVLSGHSVYRGGVGLPHECVRETIMKGLLNV